MSVPILAVTAALSALLVHPTGVADLTEVELPEADPVVVAQFDTGTNPFHPCFRRDYWDEPGFSSPRDLVPTYPADAEILRLSYAETYGASRLASQAVIGTIRPGKLYAVQGTNLSFYGLGVAKEDLIDYYPHGSQASSQIGCAQFGMASNAQLVILNWYRQPSLHDELLAWVADQSWIDIVHLNIQDTPLPVSGTTDRRIQAIIGSGKLVVIAAGNGVGGGGAAYPMELSRWNGPPGSFIAGANDNGGYTYYSNYNPHAVMDGMGTAAAEPYGFGQTTFSGTSSASPRISGYAARLLGALRAEFGHTGQGLLTMPDDATRPAAGPLADGSLTAAELHEVIRKTANPNPHDSAYNGSASATSPPQPVNTPFAVYVKMGYGQLSEHTLPLAVDVAAGRSPMPERPVEDQLYELSEGLREAYWE